MSFNHDDGWLSTHGRRLVVGAAMSLATLLFVVGSFYSGWFFVTHAADRLPTTLTPPIPGREKLTGADTISVQGGSSAEQAGVPTKEASDPRFAFLLLGYGGGAHDGSYLSDSMVVVIADPTQKSLTLLSLPRDAWVPMIFNGQTATYNKLNTAFAFSKDSSLYLDRLQRYRGPQGAGTFASDTVSRLLGIPISYYVALDFAGFRQMIDAVGGVDVEVPSNFSADYPANDDPSIDPSWTVVRFRKGVEHMGGERAIQFARARETIDNVAEGSDFARSRRQRLIMEAFKARLMSPSGLVHAPQLLTIGASHVDTNYSVPSAAQLAQMIADWKNVKFYEAALTNENYLTASTGPQGTYILVPDGQDYSWSNVRAFAKTLWQNPELGSAMARTEIVVENDTGIAGVGGKVSDVLARMGYRVGTATTGTTRTTSRVVDRTGGDLKDFAGQVASALGGKLEVAMADKPAESGGILLQVGSADAGLANLVVALDSSAPSSKVGVTQAGTWAPAAPVPDPEEKPVVATPTPARRTPTVSATTAPQRVLPGGALEPTATSGAVPMPTKTAGTSLPAATSGVPGAPTGVRTPAPVPATPVPTAAPVPTAHLVAPSPTPKR